MKFKGKNNIIVSIIYLLIVLFVAIVLFIYGYSRTMDVMSEKYKEPVCVVMSGEKNAKAESAGAGIAQIKIDDNCLDLTNGIGDWIYYTDSNSISWGGIGDSTLSYLVPIVSDTEITFNANRWAGIVQVEAYGNAETIDLYSENNDTYTYTVNRAPFSVIIRRMWPVGLLLAGEFLAAVGIGVLFLLVIGTFFKKSVKYYFKIVSKADAREPNYVFHIFFIILFALAIFKVTSNFTLDSVSEEYVDTVSVSYLGEKNERALAAGLGIEKIVAGNKNLDLTKGFGDWVYNQNSNSISWSGSGSATITFQVPIFWGAKITFDSNLWGGIAQVDAYGHTDFVDLYSEDSPTYIYRTGAAPFSVLISRMLPVYLLLGLELLAAVIIGAVLTPALYVCIENEKYYIKSSNRKIEKYAIIGVFLVGFISHGYIMLNKITNHDDMPSLYVMGNGIGSGRWALGIFSGTKWVSSPMFFVLINFALLSVGAVLLVRIFKIKKPVTAILTGGILVSHPSNTTMLFYMASAPSYSLSLVLSIYSVYLIAERINIRGGIAALICLVVSLGIYQAYFPVAAALLLVVLARFFVRETPKNKDAIIRAISYLLFLAASMIGYLIATKVICSITGNPLVSYRNIDSLGGARSFSDIIEQCCSAYRNFVGFNSSIAPESFLSKFLDYATAIVLLITGIVLFVRFALMRRFFLGLSIVLITLLFPIACNLVYLYGVYPYALMLGGVICTQFAVLLLAEAVIENYSTQINNIRFVSLALTGIIALTVFQNAYISDTEQYFQQKRMNAAYMYLDRVVTRIQMTDGYYNDIPIALVGNATDRTITDLDNLYPTRPLLGGTMVNWFVNSTMGNDWERDGTFKNWIAFSGRFLSSESTLTFANNPVVKDMPCYPLPGSIAVVNGVMVVHFSNKE